MIIKCSSEEYGELISRFINSKFPEVSVITNTDKLEILSTLLIGTKEVRYGTLPSPEHYVVIRDVIREAINSNIPIPILIPWGGVKSNLIGDVDIAELMAINRLITLNQEVKKIYSPGLFIVIRIEDLSGYSLFSLEGKPESIKYEIDRYSTTFERLVHILHTTNDINLLTVKETNMPRAKDFEVDTLEYSTLLYNYFVATANYRNKESKMIETSEYKALADIGWKGDIPFIQRDHYLNSYYKLYGDSDPNRQLQRLSLYFAGAIARRHLNMSGKLDYWTKYIQLTFVQPVAGVPEGFDYNYIYYRTLPLSQARTHIAPWRAKGYLKITGNDVCSKLTTFRDADLISELTSNTIILKNENTNISIKSDYLLI